MYNFVLGQAAGFCFSLWQAWRSKLFFLDMVSYHRLGHNFSSSFTELFVLGNNGTQGSQSFYVLKVQSPISISLEEVFQITFQIGDELYVQWTYK